MHIGDAGIVWHWPSGFLGIIITAFSGRIESIVMRILILLGTRPEAIKLAPVVRELRTRGSQFDVKVCSTGQHRQMLDQVLSTFGIRPEFDLGLMRPNQTLFDLTADAIRNLRGVLEECKPDVLLVQGDTTTVFAGAMAAYYSRVSVGHVEAGLRTDNKFSPFPEEANRRLTSVLADYHFGPTPRSRENLLREGVEDCRIYVTGNTVIDALLWAGRMLDGKRESDFPELAGLTFRERMILVTGHRRENFGEGFQNICRGLKTLAQRNRDVDIVYPVHLNPNVRGPVFEILGGMANIKLIEPLSYLPFVFLMTRAELILTDSGGVQEEAPSLGKPVLVMRDTTERPEAVAAGTVKLVGTDAEQIIREGQDLLDRPERRAAMSRAQNPYGDGRASERIAAILAGEAWTPFGPPSGS